MKSHHMLDIQDRKPLCIFMIRRFSDVRRTTARSICDSMSTKDCLKITCSSGFQNNTTYKSSRGQGQQDMRNHTHEQFLRSKSIFERLSVSFLNTRGRDFGEKLPSNSFFYGIAFLFLNGHLNIAIFYSGFFTSQKQKTRMALQSVHNIQKNCQRVKRYRKRFLCK